MNPFKNEPLRNRIALYGIVIAVYLISVFLAFDAGMDHQKAIGQHGNECADGTWRQPGAPGGAAECRNGYWFLVPPEVFPRDKLEPKK
jgi:hypothetical protein